MVAVVSIPLPAKLLTAAAYVMSWTSKPDLDPLRWLSHAPAGEAG